MHSTLIYLNHIVALDSAKTDCFTSSFPLFVGILCLPLFCYALLCFLSVFFFCKYLEENERVGCFAFIFTHVLLLYMLFAVPPCAVSWSAVCDCGIS